MSEREYIGARYVPIFADPAEWTNTRMYEPLTIVMHEGNSFTSKQFVPFGIDINNDAFWAKTGNYNAQVEQYRQEVLNISDELNDIKEVLNKAEIVPTIDDIAKTTSDYVLVLENNSTYGLDNFIFYEKTSATRDTIERDDGTYIAVSPINFIEKPSNAPITDLFNCAASYISQSGLTYGNEHTLFSNFVGTEINCSSFVEACLQGITYNNSRYHIGSINQNIIGRYTTENMNKTPGDFGYLETWKLASWFLQRKEFYEITSPDDIKKLEPGDILFGSNNINTDVIYKIDHCMIVLHVFKDDGAILIAQGGGLPNGVSLVNMQNTVCKITLANFAGFAGNYFVGYARPTYGSGQINGENITKGVNTRGTVIVEPNSSTPDPILASIRTTEKIDSTHMYYLVCTGKLPNYDEDGVYLALTRLNPFANLARPYHVNFHDGVCIIPFVVPDANEMSYQDLHIRAITQNVTETQTFRIDTLAIYKGYCPLSEGYAPINLTNIIGNDFFENYSYIDNNGNNHLQIQLRLDADNVMPNNTSKTIGTIENYVPYALNKYTIALASRIRMLPISIDTSGNLYMFNGSGSEIGTSDQIRIES